MSEHETDLKLATEDKVDLWCVACHGIIHRTKPYATMFSMYHGDDIDICVSCIKKCREEIGRYEFEKKTYLM